MTDSTLSAYQTFLRLLGHIRPYRFAFILGLFGIVIYATTDAAFIHYFKDMVDTGLVARESKFLGWIPVIVTGYFLTRGLGSFIAEYFMGYVGRSVVRDFRSEMLTHLLYMPASYFSERKSGTLISKINYDTEQVAEAITNSVTSSLRGVLSTVGFIVVMFLINWRITLLLLTVVPILGGYLRSVGRRMRRYSSNIQKTMGLITHVGREITEGYQVIRAFEGYDYEKKRIEEVTFGNFGQEMKMIKTIALSVPFIQFLGAVAIGIFISLGTLSQDHPLGTGMSPGEFGAMFVAMLQLMRPIKQIAAVNSSIQRGIAAANSIFDFLKEPFEKDKGTLVLEKVQGKISFENVSFRYEPNMPLVLDKINFAVLPGETVAIVGRSGAGKSTLVSLIPRFYEANEGHIYLDGQDVSDIQLKSLRAQFSVVSQQVILFNGTLLENIAYGCNQKKSRQEVIEALQQAYALEFIEKLPNGLDTAIGDNGLSLSGGQRQRIAIARAFLKAAPILILDEATSNLDVESEFYIQKALQALMKDKTTFVIAHRLSTIENADKVLVLEDGGLVESGTPQSDSIRGRMLLEGVGVNAS